MESAIVLDQCLAAGPLETAAARYEAAWKPEADAVSWIGERLLFSEALERPPPTDQLPLRGPHAVGRAKSATSSYADAQRAARRLSPSKA